MSAIEVMLLRWGENNSSGRTVTFQLPEGDAPHPFKHLPSGAKNGQRMGIAVTLIAEDETEKAYVPEKMDYAKQSGQLCTLPTFVSFLQKHYCPIGTDIADVDAGEVVRNICAVNSRAILNNNDYGKTRWRNLVAEYEKWMEARHLT